VCVPLFLHELHSWLLVSSHLFSFWATYRVPTLCISRTVDFTLCCFSPLFILPLFCWCLFCILPFGRSAKDDLFCKEMVAGKYDDVPYDGMFDCGI